MDVEYKAGKVFSWVYLLGVLRVDTSGARAGAADLGPDTNPHNAP